MQLPSTLTDAQRAAIVACLRIFAEIDEQVEREEKTIRPALLEEAPGESKVMAHGLGQRLQTNANQS